MKTRLLVLAIGCSAASYAQSRMLVDEARFQWSTVRDNLLKMAQKMPAENYDFKPTAEIESFGQRMAHIAGANLRICNGLAGVDKPVPRVNRSSRDELVALVKQANAACDATFAGLNDTTAVEKIDAKLGGPFPPEPTRTKLATLYNLVRHSNEMYGYMCVYLRLKGIVPPSSAPE